MPESEPIRILYMEDDDALAQLIKKKLERAGYVVDIARDGQEGLDIYQAGHYDLVAVDQAMPVRQGLDVIRILGTQEPLPPMIMVTGSGNEQTAVEAMKLGASDYIVKDVEGSYLELLPAIIERVLRQKKLAQERQQALEALRESEARYRTIFETTGTATIISEEDTTISLVNSEFERLSGYSQKELEGLKSWVEFIMADDLDRLKAYFHSRLSEPGAGPASQEFWFIDRWKGLRNVLVTMNRIPGSHKSVISFLDITQRKRVEDTLRRRNSELALLNLISQRLGSTLDLDQVLEVVLNEVRLLMGVIASTVWLLDKETGELVCQHNTGPHSEILRGWRMPATQGLVGWSIVHGKSLNVPDTRVDERHFKGVDRTTGIELRSILCVPLRIQQNIIGVLQVVDTEVSRFDPADQTLLESLAASAAIAIENARLYERAQQEIAVRKQAEEALRQHTLELQARNEELDAFAHTVAHDLKGVAGRVMGYAMVLEEDYARLSADAMCEYLHVIGRDAHKMSIIIDELLLLAGVRKQEVQLQPMDMAPIVAEALLRVSDMIEEQQADITLPEAWPRALGYSPWIEEVWVNYISNAIKYGGKPPRVELGFDVVDSGQWAVDSERQMADLPLSTRHLPLVRFWVRDNGAGLTPEQQSLLFTPFTRLSQVDIKGHGLGLSVVQRILEKLHGQVGVESVVGQGSVFSFTLPGANSQALDEQVL